MISRGRRVGPTARTASPPAGDPLIHVGRTSRRPAGADNFLRWRRPVTEHLETRRLTWPEYGMLHWLCVKASPYTGVLRISWPALAVQTGLSPAYVARLCRRLRDKRYVGYVSHAGRRDGLVELVVDKFPLPGELYTDLSACFQRGAPADGEPAAGPAEHATLILSQPRCNMRPINEHFEANVNHG